MERGEFIPKVDEEILKQYRKPYENAFIVNDVNLIEYVPTYVKINEKTDLQGRTVYYLRRASPMTLFLNSFYWAVHNFMTYLGYMPDSPFLYGTYLRIKNQRYKYMYQEKVYQRLTIYRKRIKYGNVNRTFLFVRANFFSNDKTKDLGFYLRAGARDVQLHVFPNIKLTDQYGKKIPPEIFFYLFLLKINYPKYVYYFNKQNGTLPRVFREYYDVVEKKGKFKEWRF